MNRQFVMEEHVLLISNSSNEVSSEARQLFHM